MEIYKLVAGLKAANTLFSCCSQITLKVKTIANQESKLKQGLLIVDLIAADPFDAYFNQNGEVIPHDALEILN